MSRLFRRAGENYRPTAEKGGEQGLFQNEKWGWSGGAGNAIIGEAAGKPAARDLFQLKGKEVACVMSIEAVKEYLKEYGLEDREQEFAVSSATIELAGQALGTEPARIAKTISLHLGEGCLLLLAAGDAKIDNSRFKAEFHTKASMLRGDEVLAMTGYPVGGVCPFANPEGVRVVCDESLRRFDVVYPAAGTPSSAVRLTCEELFRASRAEKWVDVCKGWRPEEQQ